MNIITVVSDKTQIGYNLLERSCHFNRLNLITLTYDGNFNTNRIKDILLYEYLDSLKPDSLVLFTDGYDTFFVSGQGEIIDKFSKLGADILFSAETNCYPDKNLASLYPKIESRYKFLNSGGFMGKAGIIKQFLSDKLTTEESRYQFSNQYLWTRRFFLNQNRIKLDYNCEIFCTFSPEAGGDLKPEANTSDISLYTNKLQQWFDSTFEIRQGRVINTYTKSSPCNLHFNGNAKFLMLHAVTSLVSSH